jgi:hypothetical protein
VTGDFLVPRAAWDDQLVDVPCHRQPEGEFHQPRFRFALLQCQAEKHSFYTVPIKCSLMEQVWRPLIEDGLLRRRHAQTLRRAIFEPSGQAPPKESGFSGWDTRWRRR